MQRHLRCDNIFVINRNVLEEIIITKHCEKPNPTIKIQILRDNTAALQLLYFIENHIS